MAEVAIPMAVLGVMYIISNKDKEQEKKEAFTNSLPNTRRPVKNYPVDKHRDLLNETNVQTYQGYRNKNENLYQPEGYKKALELNEKKVGQFQSLTGETINSKSMEHNNMVPFFGSKVTQGTGEKGYEGLLDLYTGSGSQQNKKEGIAPLFKPQANMSHVHGTPSTTEFMMNRQKSSPNNVDYFRIPVDFGAVTTKNNQLDKPGFLKKWKDLNGAEVSETFGGLKNGPRRRS